jgi:hypothetical protein
VGVAPGDMGEVLQGLARADLRAAPTPGRGAAPGHARGRRRRNGEDLFCRMSKRPCGPSHRVAGEAITEVVIRGIGGYLLAVSPHA